MRLPPIDDVIPHLEGYRLVDGKIAPCPSCKGGKEPADSEPVTTTGGRWRCLSCSAQGDVLAFAALALTGRTPRFLRMGQRQRIQRLFDASTPKEPNEPRRSSPPPEVDSNHLEWLRDLAQDFLDLRSEPAEDQQEALARLLEQYLFRIADGNRPPREIIKGINEHLPRPIHVPKDILSGAIDELVRSGRARRRGPLVELYVGPSKTRSTWTLDLGTLAVGTAPFEEDQRDPATPSGSRPTTPTATLGTASRSAPPRRGGPSRRSPRATTMGTVTLDPPLTQPGTRPTLTLRARQADRVEFPRDTLPELQPGVTLNGTYRLEEKLGQGGMGQVWRATSLAREVHGSVAIKTFFSPDPRQREALVRELELLQKLRRSDLFPRVHNAFEEAGRLFIVMDWVPGQNLRDLVGGPGALRDVDRELYLHLMAQVADRLAYLHAWQPQPILFRDLKPSNVMVDPSAGHHLRLVDFGISHVLASDGADEIRMGSRGYVAPEVREGRLARPIDIFSMGRLALFLLYGHDDFDRIGPGTQIPFAEVRGLAPGLTSAALAVCSEQEASRPNDALRALDLLKGATAKTAQAAGTAGPGSSDGLIECPACESGLLRAFAVCPRCGAPRKGASHTKRHRIELRSAEWQASTETVPPRALDAWERLLELHAAADLTKLVCLGHIQVEPYDYQREAAVHVLRNLGGRALIADDVGLGKTIEAGLLIKEYLLRGLASKCLVVSPPAALLNQLREEFQGKFGLSFREFDPAKAEGYPDRFVGRDKLGETDLVIVSSYKLRRDENAAEFERVEWDIIVVDECHHIRRHTNKLSKAIRRVSARSSYRIFLSATPFSGKVDELWAVYTALDPGRLGVDLNAYHRQYCVRNKGQWVGLPDRIRPTVKDLTVRRRRQELSIAFPGREARQLSAELGSYEALYERFAEDVCSKWSGGLPRYQLLRQFCTSFESVRQSSMYRSLSWSTRASLEQLSDADHPKVRWLIDECLPRLPKSEKVLLFTHYRASQTSILRLLKQAGYKALGLLGRDSRATLREFRDGSAQVLVCGDGAGEGLNLQFCSMMLNFDLPWDPMRIEQRVGRIQRLGQRRRKVSVLNLVLDGTVEARVLEILDRKLGLFQNLLGETEEILGDLLRTDRSFEAWLGSMLTDDGSVDSDLFRQRARDVERARRSAQHRMRTYGRQVDDLVGSGLGAGRGRSAASGPDLDELDLGFLDDLDV